MGKDKIIQEEYIIQGVRSILMVKRWGILIFQRLEKDEFIEEVEKEFEEKENRKLEKVVQGVKQKKILCSALLLESVIRV